jgi:hypothetical protein
MTGVTAPASLALGMTSVVVRAWLAFRKLALGMTSLINPP